MDATDVDGRYSLKHGTYALGIDGNGARIRKSRRRLIFPKEMIFCWKFQTTCLSLPHKSVFADRIYGNKPEQK